MPPSRPPFDPELTAAALRRLLGARRQSIVVEASTLDRGTVSKMLHGSRLTWANIDAFLRAIGATYADLERELSGSPSPSSAPSSRPQAHSAGELGPSLLELVADLARRVTRLEEELRRQERDDRDVDRPTQKREPDQRE